MNCPKCRFDQDESNVECVRCGLVFSKFEALQKKMEQSNSRYSPQGPATETAASQDEPDQSKTVLPAPVVSELLKNMEKIQLGVTAALKFQESLAADLDGLKSQMGTAFSQLEELRQGVDQKIMNVQSRIQPMAESTQRLLDSFTQKESMDTLHRDLESMHKQIGKLAQYEKTSKLIERITPRLEELESIHAEVKSLLGQGSAAGAPSTGAPEVVLIKTEVQALRAEVRGLLEQSVAPKNGTTAPAFEPKALDRLEERIEELKGRMDDTATKQDEASSDALVRLNQGEEKIKELERAVESFAGRFNSVQKANEEIDHLKDAHQRSVKELHQDLQAHRDELNEKLREVAALSESVHEIEAVIQKLRTCFVSPKNN